MSKRFPQPDLSNVSELDWARLAAYIDGEGCISIKSVHGYHAAKSRRVFYLDVTVANTDPRLGQWLKTIFGGSVSVSKRGHLSPNWAPLITWTVASAHAAAIVLRCLPFFVIKREQADVALSFQSTILPGRPYGMKGRPAELIARQQQHYEQLQSLKGTASRPRRTASSTLH